jgi:predicted MFS family arabinose efflux permease
VDNLRMQVVIFFENPMSAVPALLCIFDARHSTLSPVAPLDASVTDRLWSPEELVERTSNWRSMRSRSYIWIGIFIGSTVGGLIPELWGDDVLSYSSVLLSGVGALVGLWIGFKISD